MIPFHRSALVGHELDYIQQALQSRHTSGDGPFTKKCHTLLKQELKTNSALLTHSCTAALEMAAILADIKPGDEVILPSYTFVSSANSIVLRGGVPVFVDIRKDTLNLDETLIERAITKKTKAIMAVHYAGVACEMRTILKIAKQYSLRVIEDAAQGYKASYYNQPLGTIGDFGAISFHQTKNIVSGEGGALLTRDESLARRAEIVREKGTDRSQFLRGEVDKYCWRDIGSSYLPSDIIAAYLLSQLESAENLTEARLKLWTYYDEALRPLGLDGRLRTPTIPEGCQHNAHIYSLVWPTAESAGRFVAHLKEKNIQATYHYVPLHTSPAGLKYTRVAGSLAVTEHTGQCLVRLPLWNGLETSIDQVTDVIVKFIKSELFL